MQALAEGLAARGHEVEVHTTFLHKEIPFTPKRDWDDPEGPVKVVRHPAFTPGKTIHYTTSPSMLAAILKRAGDVDVVHAHSYGYFQTVACALAHQTRGTPYVLTPHFHPHWSMEGGEPRKQLRGIYDRTVSRYVLHQADRVIGVSSGEMQVMSMNPGFDWEKVTLIPNGIHWEKFETIPDPAPFREHFGLGDAPLVLFAGRLAVNKGLHHLVKAYAKIREEHPRARLVLAGEDQDQGPRLKALAKRLDVQDGVLFTGHLSLDLFRSAVAAGDVFVLPSEWEAFGIVLAEAMACERPCVATKVGGAPDVVVDGETGHLVDYGHSDALAEAVSGLLADPAKARRFGEAGRKRVKAEFTWDAVVDRTEQLYHEMLEQRSS